MGHLCNKYDASLYISIFNTYLHNYSNYLAIVRYQLREIFTKRKGDENVKSGFSTMESENEGNLI